MGWDGDGDGDGAGGGRVPLPSLPSPCPPPALPLPSPSPCPLSSLDSPALLTSLIPVPAQDRRSRYAPRQCRS
jgi:hypothetical protein